MEKYIKKYFILLLVMLGLQGLLQFFVVSQLPILLLEMGIEINEGRNLVNMLSINVPYLMNIIIALVVLRDLSENKIKGIPVVLLTVFSYLAGVIFFLFLMNNQINRNDK